MRLDFDYIWLYMYIFCLVSISFDWRFTTFASLRLITMHSNIVLRVADTRLSPQTISSSGYHSDLSSTNDSPGSSHRNRHERVEYYASIPVRTKIQTNKMTSLSQVSNFLRKQYERAKSKFISEKHHSRTIKTSTKATSTTPVPYLMDSIHRPSMLSKYKQSSFIEPVRFLVKSIDSNLPISFSRRYVLCMSVHCMIIL